jgi:hypothetical protein
VTAQWRGDVRCPNCGIVVQTEPPFDSWVRENPMLDSVQDAIVIQDGDKWVHRYAVRTKGRLERDVQYLMSLEVKTFDADMNAAQRDTLHIVNQAIRTILQWREKRDAGRFIPGHPPNVQLVTSFLNGRVIQLECYGVHKLRMSGAGPLDSAHMTWDNKPITTDQLTLLLRFDLNPDTLLPLEHRRHKRIDRSPALFDLPAGG